MCLRKKKKSSIGTTMLNTAVAPMALGSLPDFEQFVLVVVEACELDGPGDSCLDDLSADPSPPDQEALVDELLDRPSYGRPGEPQVLADGDFVFEAGARGDDALSDCSLEAAGDLEVQGNGARAVEVFKQGARPYRFGAHGALLGAISGAGGCAGDALCRQPYLFVRCQHEPRSSCYC
ncbi:hypothetical protein FQR65_LT20873 [Abscondita terminalis]|nr:hypothetical protein FQR65_LT20873 [Abscondita terminalis]